ncbi:MAG: SpoVA/SpoVAEb family sporulation membrane protein [Clostridia bacterium]|nr:SpoVA/SpoVAEb family sporulation membrane protein [Clostridia bacterium]
MNSDYKKYVEDRAKRSPCILNTLKAFVVGGLICCIGKAFTDFYSYLGMEKDASQTVSTVTLIFLAGLLTGIGWFGKMGKFSGAGTLVPITGFSNAITSPAIENKTEGLIYGTCAKMFVIAGPVIVFGTLASSIYGVIYYIVEKVM